MTIKTTMGGRGEEREFASGKEQDKQFTDKKLFHYVTQLKQTHYPHSSMQK
jgi:hypothetical protein